MNDDEYQSLMNRTSAAISNHERQIKALKAEQDEASLAREAPSYGGIEKPCRCMACIFPRA